MNKQKPNNILLFGIPSLVIILAFVIAYAPKPVDWTLSYSNRDVKPFGSKMLFELLPVLMGDSSIIASHSNLSVFIGDDNPIGENFIFLNNNVDFNAEDQFKIEELLLNGNNVFIAAENYEEGFLDSLKVGVEITTIPQFAKVDSISLNLANRSLKKGLGYWYEKGINDNYFTSYDTLHTSVLGINSKGKTNFIRIKKGAGWLYLHLNPIVFTNYNLLDKDNADYAFKCLSYLPQARTLWDEHYKVGMNRQKTPLSYIFDNPPLRLAYYLTWIGAILFLIFESARRQRMIPIVRPPENSTVNFVETIGRLYFSKKNHLDIAIKKYTYFKEFVRSRYYVSTSPINEELYQQIAEKSNIPIRSIKQLFEMGESLKKIQRLSEADLEQFNRKIEFFYEHCQ
ncbi:DUF4350 domain-containing protein [Carboxylicivirga caseinilyticus]|uniref:DUF4350 domain-containing protein n=1 Tax=Carboxylicivirga caseinilyticus TaxID=3417572 RepID=UPI003D33413D|nr:DUF4350 domain-containing protein [Marinilabiliaceae bacterium A049]